MQEGGLFATTPTAQMRYQIDVKWGIDDAPPTCILY